MSSINYSYVRKRRDFGRQPLFCEVREQMLDSILPDVSVQRQFMLRNPVHQGTQATVPQSECTVNTPVTLTRDAGANHVEGGWPKEVNCLDEETTARYRRRFERDDAYVHSVLTLYPRLKHYVNQNNAIEMYERYFNDMPPEAPVEKIFARLKTVCRDPFHRPIASLDWTNDEQSRLVATYCKKTHPYDQEEKSNTGYFWNIEYPNDPESEFEPPVPCWQIVCPPMMPTTVIGGLKDGTICVFDIREQKTPVAKSPLHLAHRDPVTVLSFMGSRLNNEFFTGSTDGRCLWWDIRDISEPVDEQIMSIRPPPDEEISMANAEGVTSLQFDRAFPTKYLCGTDTGFVVTVNRKGKTNTERMTMIKKAHNGPVRAVSRNPVSPKVILTCGDFTAHVWNEDISLAPIITGTSSRYPVNDAAWAPSRVSSYMTVGGDGTFRFWDILRNYRDPSLTFLLSKYPLLNIKPNEEGFIVAMGDEDGAVFCLALSENMVISAANDKAMFGRAIERESKREHTLESRVKEIRLKMREAEEAVNLPPEEPPDEEALDRETEEEYKKAVMEGRLEFFSTSALPTLSPPPQLKKKK
ncbi:dynein intermediate chain 3, ciliary [Plutella xylostella]|uniref:dynein intermediate chain 3, ciliary n=1 Tax=Plutella xylostella TaxID=51655 RepID=UPI0020323005|nr:dynein intermediate chain 3, ciliary [Plutella xylostella]